MGVWSEWWSKWEDGLCGLKREYGVGLGSLVGLLGGVGRVVSVCKVQWLDLVVWWAWKEELGWNMWFWSVVV